MTTEIHIPFDGELSLASTAEFLAGFAPAAGATARRGARLVLGFGLDGTYEPVAVALIQEDRRLTARLELDVPAAPLRAQLERILGLDVDVTEWAALAERDPVIGALIRKLPGFRPPPFPSPYEAAVWGILTQRVPMTRAAMIKEQLAREHGTRLTVDGDEVLIVPAPGRLLEVTSLSGLPAEKLRRLHGIAEATLEGRLEAERLRAMAEPAALADLESLRGVGPWTAAHILYRGAGITDAFAGGEPRLARAAELAYGLEHTPSRAELVELAEGWRPYRMWVAILLVRSIAGTGAWHRPGDSAARGRRSRS